jgi:hypothetical protein
LRVVFSKSTAISRRRRRRRRGRKSISTLLYNDLNNNLRLHKSFNRFKKIYSISP